MCVVWVVGGGGHQKQKNGILFICRLVLQAGGEGDPNPRNLLICRTGLQAGGEGVRTSAIKPKKEKTAKVRRTIKSGGQLPSIFP